MPLQTRGVLRRWGPGSLGCATGATLCLVDGTVGALRRLRRFLRSMSPELPPVDVVLQQVRDLLQAARVRFKIVGGVAVVHHGYARTTEDVDVVIEADGWTRLEPELASHGFERSSAGRLRHMATGVPVDVLVAGTPLPRAGAGVYPSPTALGASPRDPHVVDLAGLVELKLRARRHRDMADVVELVKRIDEARYIELESSVEKSLRPELAALRRDALEELAAGG